MDDVTSISNYGALKRRIIDAMDTIGRPATSREISELSAIDTPIHARLCELVRAGVVIKESASDGSPSRYSLAVQTPLGQTPDPAQPQPQPHLQPERDPIIDILQGNIWRTSPKLHVKRLRALAANRLHKQVQAWLLELASDIEKLG